MIFRFYRFSLNNIQKVFRLGSERLGIALIRSNWILIRNNLTESEPFRINPQHFLILFDSNWLTLKIFFVFYRIDFEPICIKRDSKYFSDWFRMTRDISDSLALNCNPKLLPKDSKSFSGLLGKKFPSGSDLLGLNYFPNFLLRISRKMIPILYTIFFLLGGQKIIFFAHRRK